MDSIFKEAYEKLNFEQKLAVDTIDGPVLVIAGPGSGKTQILTIRIANILKKVGDISAENILCLTYTETGAVEMKNRLAEIIGPKDTDKVTVCTFHSFCAELRRRYSNYFVEKKIVNDIEKIKILKRILEKEDFSPLISEFSALSFLTNILGYISNFKREGFDNDALDDELSKLQNHYLEVESLYNSEKSEKKRKLTYTKDYVTDIKASADKLKQFNKIFDKYNDHLKNNNLIDFEDLINEVVIEFETNEDFSMAVQERYLYILVDEFQDTNSAQNRIIEKLADYNLTNNIAPNIFAVGDDDQSIFKFQGASVTNIVDFTNKFAGTKIIVLKKNYRSSTEIIEYSRKLLDDNKLKIENYIPDIDKEYVSNSGNIERPKLYEFSTNNDEEIFVATYIKNYLLERPNQKLSEIAIIFRKNKEGLRLKKALNYFQIPYNYSTKSNVLENKFVNDFINILKLINDPLNNDYFFNCLYIDILGISDYGVYKFIYENNHRKNKELINSFKENIDQLNLIENDGEKIIKFSEDILELHRYSKNNNLESLLQEIVVKFEIYNRIISNKKSVELIDEIEALNSFINYFTTIEKDNEKYTLSEMLEDLTIIKDVGYIIESKNTIENNGVKLTTAHSSKGSQFELVIMFGSTKKNWMQRNSYGLKIKILDDFIISNKDEEEEKRLFYVGTTRAKKDLIITSYTNYSPTITNKNEELCPFIKNELIDIKETFDIEKNNNELKLKLNFSPNKIEANTLNESYLKDIVSKQVLSVTGFNEYQNCAYKYKLKYVYNIPSQKKYIFGNVIHETLQIYFMRYQKSKTQPTLDELLKIFTDLLDKEKINENVYQKDLKKGNNVLTKYYETYSNTFQEPFFIERWTFAEIDGLKLKGKIDRGDLVKGEFKLTDYKTGKVRRISKNSQNPDKYINQLKFYKLLIENDKEFTQKVNKLVIDFVEPDIDGTYKNNKLEYEFSQDEMDQFIENVKSIHADILSLKFDKTIDKRSCQYCEFKDHCYPNGFKLY